MAAERTRAATDRGAWWIDAAVLAAMAVVLRIPAWAVKFLKFSLTSPMPGVKISTRSPAEVALPTVQ